MGSLDDFRNMMEQGAKTGIETFEIEQLNNNFAELVKQLAKIEADYIRNNEEICNRLEILEQKKELSQAKLQQLQQKVSEIKKQLIDLDVKLDEYPEEPKKLKNKIEENQSLLKKISWQMHNQNTNIYIWYIWAWMMFCTVTAIAQQIFTINGLWSWIKVVTGLKVLLEML